MSTIIILLLLLSGSLGSNKDEFEILINFIYNNLRIQELTIFYAEQPTMQDTYIDPVLLDGLARHTEIRPLFIDLNRIEDVSVVLRSANRMVNLVLMLEEHKAKGMLKKIVETEWYSKARVFLIAFTPEEFLREIQLPVNSQVYFLSFSQQDIVVDEAYSIHKAGPLTVNRLKVEEGFLTKEPLARRSNFQGFNMKAATAEDKPFTIFTKSEELIELAGFVPNIWKQLESTLNFTTEFHFLTSENYGTKQHKTKWSKIIEMLQNNETDLGVAPLTDTGERLPAADIMVSFWKSWFIAMFKKPQGLSFKGTHGLITFAIHLLATVIVATAVKLATFLLQQPCRLASLSIIFDVLYAFCQQGVTDRQWSSNASCRLVWLVIQMAGFLAISIYSATFISLQAVQHPLDYNDFVNLLKSNTYGLEYVKGSSAAEFVQSRMKDLVFSGFHKEDNIAIVMNKVCSDKQVFISSVVGDMTDVACLNEMIFIPVGYNQNSFMTRKGFPHTSIISWQLLKMHETGQMQRLRKRWFRSLSEAVQEPESINLEHVMPGLVGLGVGIAIAGGCLTAECCMALHMKLH